jgi:hypothetical protein
MERTVMVLTGLVGVGLLLAALFSPIAYYCTGVRNECVLDGVLCFGIIYAEYRDWT